MKNITLSKKEEMEDAINKFVLSNDEEFESLKNDLIKIIERDKRKESLEYEFYDLIIINDISLERLSILYDLGISNLFDKFMTTEGTPHNLVLKIVEVDSEWKKISDGEKEPPFVDDVFDYDEDYGFEMRLEGFLVNEDNFNELNWKKNQYKYEGDFSTEILDKKYVFILDVKKNLFYIYNHKDEAIYNVYLLDEQLIKSVVNS